MEVKAAIGILVVTLGLLASRWPATRKLLCPHPCWAFEKMLPGGPNGMAMTQQRCICCETVRVVYA